MHNFVNVLRNIIYNSYLLFDSKQWNGKKNYPEHNKIRNTSLTYLGKLKSTWLHPVRTSRCQDALAISTGSHWHPQKPQSERGCVTLKVSSQMTQMLGIW